LLSGGQGALLALRRERNTFVGVSFLLLFSLRLLLAKKKVIAPSVRGVSDVFVFDESEVCLCQVKFLPTVKVKFRRLGEVKFSSLPKICKGVTK